LIFSADFVGATQAGAMNLERCRDPRLADARLAETSTIRSAGSVKFTFWEPAEVVF